MRAEILLLAHVSIGLVFLFSAVAKLRDVRAYTEGVRAYGVLPSTVVVPSSLAVPAVEAALALAHLSGFGVRFAPPAAIVLLLAFMFVAIRSIRRGDTLPCLCFGASDSEALSRSTVVRLGLLLTAEAALLASATSGDQWTLRSIGASDAALTIVTSVLMLSLLSWIESGRSLAVLRAQNREEGCRAAMGD